jgi:glycosyltransferase involved in cell wall biosynthesis
LTLVDLNQLRELRKCPSGDAGAWRARYQGLIAEKLEHHVASAPKVSVVVVAYRSEDRVVGCLEHLRDQHGLSRDEIEIILLDNGGLEKARPEFPRLLDTEVRMTHNVGLCPARNLGAALARADIVSFIDDDGLVEPDYYQNALRHLHDPSIVAIRTRIVFKDHRYFTALASHYDRGEQLLDDNLITEGSSVLRLAPFMEVGGFADSLSPFEGLDFSYRLKSYRPEARIVYAPDLVMHHDYVDGFKKLYRKSIGYRSLYDLAEAGDPGIEAFVRAHQQRRFPDATRRWDEKLARGALGAVMSSLRFYSRLTRKQSSYIPVKT